MKRIYKQTDPWNSEFNLTLLLWIVKTLNYRN